MQNRVLGGIFFNPASEFNIFYFLKKKTGGMPIHA
jgi:hypothetical protein